MAVEARAGWGPGLDLRQEHRRAFGREPQVIAHAPGRVNLLGGHADYNEGFVLPAAIDLYTHAALSPRADGAVVVRSLNLGEECRFGPGDDGAGLPSWGRYLWGVVSEVAALGHRVPGFDLLIHGEVPIGSGLSSSATLTVAAFTAIDRLAGLDLPPLEAVRLCRRAEERHAGVGCGIMDPFASYLGRRGHALLIDCRTLEHEEVPLPAGHDLVVLDTGVRRRLAASEFGSRRRECEAAVQALRGLLGEPVRALRDVSPDQLVSVIDRLPPELRRRAAHVVSDLARAVRGADALRRGDLEEFGAAMFETHASLRELYEVSTPELDYLVELARSAGGVVGARLTGAGFGGCVVCLVRAPDAAALQETSERRFAARFGRPPRVAAHAAADGARLTVESA
jgi:galactokinase